MDASEGSLRLAVIDGCTPMAISPGSPGSVGIDGGIWAAAVIGAALRAWNPAEQCLRAANVFLCDERVEISQARNQAAAVVADLHADGVRLCRAMDCEAWIETDRDDWIQLFPAELLEEEPLVAYEAWKQANPSATSAALRGGAARPARGLELSDASRLRSSSSYSARFEQLQLSPVPRQLVLAPDDTRISRERLGDLDAWPAELRDWGRRVLGHVAGGRP